MKLLSRLEPESIDLVFADPPFNIGYDYDVYDDDRTSREFLDFSKRWITGVHRALKPAGSFWLAIGDEYAAELKLIAQNEAGFHCRSWVIWYYTFGVNCVRGFSRSHTHLFHFVKDPNNFTFNRDNPAVRVASARQLVYADPRANTRGRLPDNTWILRPQDLHDEPPAPGVDNRAFSPDHDTWYFSRVAGTFNEREGFHGCQMPEQLLGRIIRISSNTGDLVLDPFGGSGTTLVVSKKLGRRWLGFELSKDYVKRIKKRLAKTNVGDELDGPADPARSSPKTSQGRKRTAFRNGKPVYPLDPETKVKIITAFTSASSGYPADVVLCDPELNAEFIRECKNQGLKGDISNWNRLLLRIRKAGELPKATAKPRTPTTADMDAYNAAAEAALQLLALDYNLTLDEILCSPMAAADFDRLAAGFCPAASPLEFRWAAMSLRKRAKKSTRTAIEKHEEFAALARKKFSLKKFETDKYRQAGVYLVTDGKQPIYAGESRNVGARVEQLMECDAWRQFNPEEIQLLKTPAKFTASDRHGLQSWLIGQHHPLLNWIALTPPDDSVGSEI